MTTSMGGAGGLVSGATLGAKADRGVAGVVVGSALGTVAGAAAGLGIGALGTMEDPSYPGDPGHASMAQLPAVLTTGCVATVAAGAAFFGLGNHPSSSAVAYTGVAILFGSLLAGAFAGAIHAVPDAPPAPEKPPVTQPQPLPRH